MDNEYETISKEAVVTSAWGLGKPENLSHDSRCPGLDSKSAPPEHTPSIL